MRDEIQISERSQNKRNNKSDAYNVTAFVYDVERINNVFSA